MQNKFIKIISSIFALCFGAFMIVYGGMDDSPGAQFLGLVSVGLGIFGIAKSIQKNTN
jgi:hypothetical protein